MLLRVFYYNKSFFDFSGFDEPKSRDTDSNLHVRFFKNFDRNVKATGLYFFIGIVLSAFFQQYVSAEFVSRLFGGSGAEY